MDKNVIHRIETNQRYVSDIEVKAFCEIFRISYSDLLDTKNSRHAFRNPESLTEKSF